MSIQVWPAFLSKLCLHICSHLIAMGPEHHLRPWALVPGANQALLLAPHLGVTTLKMPQNVDHGTKRRHCDQSKMITVEFTVLDFSVACDHAGGGDRSDDCGNKDRSSGVLQHQMTVTTNV